MNIFPRMTKSMIKAFQTTDQINKTILQPALDSATGSVDEVATVVKSTFDKQINQFIQSTNIAYIAKRQINLDVFNSPEEALSAHTDTFSKGFEFPEGIVSEADKIKFLHDFYDQNAGAAVLTDVKPDKVDGVFYLNETHEATYPQALIAEHEATHVLDASFLPESMMHGGDDGVKSGVSYNRIANPQTNRVNITQYNLKQQLNAFHRQARELPGIIDVEAKECVAKALQKSREHNVKSESIEALLTEQSDKQLEMMLERARLEEHAYGTSLRRLRSLAKWKSPLPSNMTMEQVNQSYSTEYTHLVEQAGVKGYIMKEIKRRMS
jgi:hypothetical protein